MSFPLVEIGSICEVINGSTPSRNKQEYWGGHIDWFTPKDLSKIEGKYVYGAPEKISEQGYKSCSTTLIPKNSLLFTSRAPIGHLAINRQEVCTNQGFKTLVPKKEVDVEFLYYAIKKHTPELQDLGNGATFKELSKATISAFKIPLPPLATQKKIAAILDAADAHRQKTKQLLTKYDELAQSIFLEMFGDPVTNPKGWEVKKLGEFIKSLNTGVSVNSTDEPYSTNEFGILKTSCVYTGIFRPQEAKVIRKDEYGRMKLNPKSDSIIISRMNTTELVGKSAYVPQTIENLYLPDRLWQTEKSKMEHDAKWLSMAIAHNSFMNEISKISSGTSGSMKNISKKAYLSLRLIYPPVLLQKDFASKISVIETQKTILIKSVNNSENLFNSLLQKAFKGELVK